mmetsp:Transcript_32990/g.44693  ORF Transcript_32990/g.44693 Transcript_32990/m.44693 type:complete len:113 (-) Transcript_32990:628-966(-)
MPSYRSMCTLTMIITYIYETYSDHICASFNEAPKCVTSRFNASVCDHRDRECLADSTDYAPISSFAQVLILFYCTAMNSDHGSAGILKHAGKLNGFLFCGQHADLDSNRDIE